MSGISAHPIPILSPKTGAAHAIYCAPAFKDGDTTLNGTNAVFDKRLSVADVTDRQVALMGAAVSALRQMRGSRRLIVPVSSRALIGEEQADRVAEPLKALDAEERSILILELLDFAASPSMDVVEDAIMPLMDHCFGFLAAARIDLEDATVFATCNVMALTVDASRPAAERPRYEHIAEIAQKRRMRCFLWNLPENEFPNAAELGYFGVTRAG